MSDLGLGAAMLGVVPDHGRQGQQTLTDAGEQAVVAAVLVMFLDRRTPFQVLEDRLDPLAAAQQRPLGRSAWRVSLRVGPFRADQVNVLKVAEPVELRTGEPAVGQNDQPAPATRW